ncbi:MAG: Crp/Fnr family transcriptional regulator [Epsilonproteobacteria bacterium]|nr:Crp/Fnr family transcriptional regulator [Campylobacterota bacterium]
MQKIIDITDEEWSYIQSVSTIKSFSKGENLNFLTEKPRQIAFILSGIVRSYLIEEDGKDYTWNFHIYSENASVNNLFVVDYLSLLTDTDSMLHFDVLEDCEIIFLDYTILTNSYIHNEKWQTYGRTVTEDAYIISRKRTATLLTKSAKERLQILEKEYPTIFDKVPNYYIASYLGITPQSLSRLQHEI